MVFSCFGACLQTVKGKTTKQYGRNACHASDVFGDAFSEDWQSVPDDVLQAMVVYLSPADVAIARLVCRHWRAMLSCYTPALTLPTSFLAARAAKTVLRTTSHFFPSVTKVTLVHAGGWCDPMQARMDVEPVVCQERRNVSLEPLAAAFTQLQHLSVADSTFTRNPWSFQQLAQLPSLSSLAVCWDTGLWAPGQVLQEAEALQPLFARTQLTALQLAKHAHTFLGEVPLEDGTLAAAANLRALVRLNLSTVSLSDHGFDALTELPSLTELSLCGQLAVSLGMLAKVFSVTTGIQSLALQGLKPCSKDLQYIAAAHSGRRHGSSSRSVSRHRHGRFSSSASPSSSSYGGSSSIGGSSQGTYQQQYLQQGQQPSGNAAGGWRTSRLWQQQQQELQPEHLQQRQVQPMQAAHSGRSYTAAASHVSSSGMRGGSVSPYGNSLASVGEAGSVTVSPGGHSTASAAAAPGLALTKSSSSGSKRRFRSADWTVVLLPLRRLHMLRLQSDMVFLGSCAALRSMRHITHIELHGAATYMQPALMLQPQAALPPSWLTQLGHNASAAAAATAAHAQQPCSSSAAEGVVSAHGVWPGLVSLHVDNLQLADAFVQSVARLASLKTLLVSGPCLLAAQQQQQQHMDMFAGGAPAAPVHQQHHQQQQHGASATSWDALLAAAAAAGLTESPDPSNMSAQQRSKLKPYSSEGPAATAADAEALAALFKALKPPMGSSSSSTSTSTKSSSLSVTATTATTTSSRSSRSSSGSSRSSAAALLNASGMRPQRQPPMANALAAMQQQQQQQPGTLLYPVLDVDVLTRLSPLTQLSKFELHLPQQPPYGLCMTPFALSHLSVTWSALTSLSLHVPTPGPQAAAAAATAAAGGGGPEELAAAVRDDAAAQLFVGLGSLSCLKHLSMTMTDGAAVSAAFGAPSWPPHPPGSAGTPLPATPEQPFGTGPGQDEVYSSGSNALAAAAAVAALPWGLLPASLESLSLSGFTGLEPDSIKGLASNKPHLRHLRLMYCQATTSVLWALTRCLPHLHTLVVKDDGLGGVGSSGLGAIVSLSHMVSLGVTLLPGSDVGPLKQLDSLRYLLLDGRSNTDLRGIKGLLQLTKLKTLVMPLLHLHHTNNTLLRHLQLALPATHIVNVSGNFGRHHGCQWFKVFSAAEREWWALPQQPWLWRPILDIQP